MPQDLRVITTLCLRGKRAPSYHGAHVVTSPQTHLCELHPTAVSGAFISHQEQRIARWLLAQSTSEVKGDTRGILLSLRVRQDSRETALSFIQL